MGPPLCSRLPEYLLLSSDPKRETQRPQEKPLWAEGLWGEVDEVGGMTLERKAWYKGCAFSRWL